MPYDDDDDDRGGYRDSYSDDPSSGDPPEHTAQQAGMDPQLLAIMKQVRSRLGGEEGEKDYVDYLKGFLAERYVHLSFVKKMELFRKAVGDEMYLALLPTPNLRWCVDQWNWGRLVAAFDAALAEAVERVNRVETDMPMHHVELWFKNKVCMCGKCWKT